MTIRNGIDSRCLATLKITMSSKKLYYFIKSIYLEVSALIWKLRDIKAGYQELIG